MLPVKRHVSVNPPLSCCYSSSANTQDQNVDAYIPRFNEQEIQEQILSLVCYLWDNFLQLYDTNEIFLIGAGNAYLGVKVLLINRGKEKKKKTIPS